MARSVMSAQDRFQPVVARGMDVVGLGGGEQELVDAAAEERASHELLPEAEHAQHAVERVLQVGDGLAALIERPSTSTSTICRSSRLKWSRKNGRTTCDL